MPSRTAPIVGMFHRPPARAILASLPSGCELKLEREPDNIHDRFAVKVIVRSALIPESQYEDLENAAAGFGFQLQEILAQSEWMLGYIAAKDGSSALVSPIMEKHEVAARLGFDIKGAPIAMIEWKD